MISEKHSQAARINGARSRGPVTPEGKAISSRNAMRHGLLAKAVLLSNEDNGLFEHFFYLFIERYHPVNDIEMSMIEEMTAACWRMHRAMAMEKHTLECGIASNPNRPAIEQITSAFCDPVNHVHLDRLQRYETRLQNIYQRALRGLAQMRKMPKTAAPAPDPLPVAPLPNEPSGPCVCNTVDPTQPLPAPFVAPCAPPRTAIQRPENTIVPFDPLIRT